jgi:hypothetical protein
MKIGGIDPTTLPVEEVLVLPRGERQLVFRATGVKDLAEFHKLCPIPTPPQALTKEGQVADTEDAGYQQAMIAYRRRQTAYRQTAYIVIQSLAPSQIEWDTVKLDAPATWLNWESDLHDAGLSTMECNRIMSLVLQANCLDERKLEEARKLFLRGTPEKSER